MNKAVFLDRDGVLNQAIIYNNKPYPPKNISELHITQGISELLAKLKNKNYLLIVITNQPDVARGEISKSWVEEVNQILKKALPLDGFRVCYHDDVDRCLCRKPLPGAILAVAKEFDIDLSQSYFIGDRWKDISAGFAAGCKTIFIDYKYDEKLIDAPDFVVTDISQIEDIILGEFHEKD